MKHIEKIEFSGDGTCGYSAGYCSDLNGYVLRTGSGWIYNYSVYYRITGEEYRKVTDSIDALNRNEICLEALVPGRFDRFAGAGYKRAYDINPHFPDGCDPYTYTDMPFLLEDGVFHFHLFYEGKHYAAVPRRTVVKDGVRTFPYRELPGVERHVIRYDGKDVFLCYGYLVEDFEGRDEWQRFHDGAVKGRTENEKGT